MCIRDSIRTDTTTQADRYVIELQGHAGGKVRTTNVWFTVGGFDTEDWTQFQQNIFKTGANSKEKFLTDPAVSYTHLTLPTIYSV